jgi:predicted DNA-binding protein (UPF0278 family)
MAIKQVPNLTVTIRVPEPLHTKLDRTVRERRDRGERISKNSVFLEALELYLYYIEEEAETDEQEDDQGDENEQEGDDDDTLGAIPRF